MLNKLIGVFLLLFMTGCATIVSGTKQDIKIQSVPDNSDIKIVRLTGSQSVPFWNGRTPSTVQLVRLHTYLITISHDGYEPAEIPIGYGSQNGWTWGNLIILFAPGFAIDSLNGAAFDLSPEKVDVSLNLLPASSNKHSVPKEPITNTKNETKAVIAPPLNSTGKE